MKTKKGLLVVLDGAGDRPQPELGGLTPLEAARTPNLDRLAAAGVCGLFDPLGPGIPVDTHVGLGVLLGLPWSDALGLPRGPVEAAGVGLPVQAGEVAMRCNFATVEPPASAGERWRIVDRRAGRIQDGTAELARELAEVDLGDGILARFRPATQHRAVLLLSGRELSGKVGDTDPGSAVREPRVEPCRALDPDDAAARRTAAAVERFLALARERLGSHPVNSARAERGLPPANGVITRGAGMLPALDSIVNRFGLRAAVVAAERTVLGLAELFRLTTLTSSTFTALPDTDLAGKAAAAREALETHDLVLVHVKAPDICSHDGDPRGKRDVLERVDEAFASLLEPVDLAIGIGADHSTDSARGDHYGDPVPAILYTPRGRRDAVESFGETACLAGGMGRLTGSQFLMSLLDAMDAVPTFRASNRSAFGLD